MEIRAAKKSDIRPLAELWAHAFPGERTVEQRVRQMEAGGVYGGIETTMLAHDDGAVAGAFRAYRMRQFFHGAWVPMMGLAAVAVGPHARRRGLGSDLCRAALRHARDRGDLLSVLYPFRPSFYEALGWGITGSLQHFRFRPESLPVTHQHPRVRLVNDASDVIAECYNAVAVRSNGMIERSARVWRQQLEWPDVHTCVLQRDGACAGYAIVHYGSGGLPEDRPLTIRELIAVDDDAYNEMLSWISLQRDSWRLVAYDALPSERFDLRLTEPRTPALPAARTLYAPVASVIRGPMLRVLDVAGALHARKTWSHDLRFTLHVDDAELADNSTPMDITVANGVAEITPLATPTPHGDDATSLRVGAPAFAQIYAGELSVSEAVRMTRARVTGDVKGLDALFRTEPEFRILDEF